MLFRKDKEKKNEIDEVKAAVSIDEQNDSKENKIEYQEELPLFDDDEIFGNEIQEEPEKPEKKAEIPINRIESGKENYATFKKRASKPYSEEREWTHRYQSYEDYPRQEGAPLFVKVEKYQEIITRLQEMRLFVSGVKDIFAIMQEIDTIRSEALNVLKVSVQRLEKSVIEMDSDLLRPKGMPAAVPHGQTEAKHIESSLAELQKQLSDLKRELQGIE